MKTSCSVCCVTASIRSPRVRMSEGLPPITTDDSGGVLEFIEDGANGFAVAARPEAIAARLDALAGDSALAARLGSAGPARVAGITWERVVEALML